MSDSEASLPRVQIEPEPSLEELVAILTSLQAASTDCSEEAVQPADRWSEIARHEQLRVPLDRRQDSWSR